MSINYALAKAQYPKQKARLTRAIKKGPDAVLDAVYKTIDEWRAWGAWPDDWARWQRAIDDVFGQHGLYPPRLEDL